MAATGAATANFKGGGVYHQSVLGPLILAMANANKHSTRTHASCNCEQVKLLPIRTNERGGLGVVGSRSGEGVGLSPLFGGVGRRLVVGSSLNS